MSDMSISKAGKRTEGKRLTKVQDEILSALLTGQSLCVSQDGEDWFLSGRPRKFLDHTYDRDIADLRARKLIANDPDPQHWTEDHSYNITPAGRTALKTGASE